MKKDEEREVPDPWESIEEVLEVVLEVLEVFLEVSYIFKVVSLFKVVSKGCLMFYLVVRPLFLLRLRCRLSPARSFPREVPPLRERP